MIPEVSTIYRYWFKWKYVTHLNELIKALGKDLIERERKMATKKTATKKTTTAKTAKTTAPVATKPDEKCVWHIGTPCSDNDTDWKEMFNHQIRIPICANHYEQHLEIMLLHKNSYDVEEILNATPEWRRAEVLTLKLSGLETGEVEP
jgi:hypothetical protein